MAQRITMLKPIGNYTIDVVCIKDMLLLDYWECEVEGVVSRAISCFFNRIPAPKPPMPPSESMIL